MAQTDLGKWMITNGGNYNPEITYEQLTIVLYNNNMFLTLKTVKGITPVNDNINYNLMAQGTATTLLSAINATDTYGVLGEVGATVSSQALVDYLADSVMNKLIEKAQIANDLTTQDDTKVLSALQGYNLKQSIDQLNSDLKTSVSGKATFNSSCFTDNGTQIKKIGTTVTARIVGTIKFDAMTSYVTNKIIYLPKGFLPNLPITEYRIIGKNITDLVAIENDAIGINKQFCSGDKSVDFSVTYSTSE